VYRYYQKTEKNYKLLEEEDPTDAQQGQLTEREEVLKLLNYCIIIPSLLLLLLFF
jgi:hypothetical protein